MAEDEEDVSSKELTEFPQVLLEKTALTKLFLDYNNLQELPERFGACFPNLKLLSVIGNQLSFLPGSIKGLTSLEELLLSENEILTLPDTICELKQVKRINLTGNHLQELPENFGELLHLQWLHCDENYIKFLPKTFGLLENLIELDLSNNCIDVILEGFGSLKSLEILDLSHNRLIELPNSFGNLPCLRTLDVSSNRIKFLPETFSSTKVIEKLYMKSNLIQLLPAWFSEMCNVVEISVRDNQLQFQALSDNFPTVAKRLRHLDMSGNFMRKLPDSFGELANLEFLHFGSVIHELERRNFQNGNWLKEIPDSFCKLTKLRELHLDENSINRLPENFGDLVLLEVLDLSQNALSNLPDSFGRLKSLTHCMLSKNNLQWLPSNFGELSNLEDLRLDNNTLVELPDSFSQLIKLKSLDLFSNHLSTIPTALNSLKNLVRLDVEGNDFEVPLSDVPLITVKPKYPERDPNLKNNWRGRPRQDLVIRDEHIIKHKDETGELPDFEPPLPPLKFSEDFLLAAVNRNMSLWKSHGDTSTGRRPVHRQHVVRRYQAELQEPVDMEDEEEEEWGEGDEEEEGYSNEDGEEDEDDGETDEDEFEPPLIVQPTTWSGSDKANTLPKSNAEDRMKALFGETECWDDEIDNSVEQYDNVVQEIHPTKMYYPPVENGAFTFAPFDIHQPDFDRRRDEHGFEDGQFDNCDTDLTTEINVDPVF